MALVWFTKKYESIRLLNNIDNLPGTLCIHLLDCNFCYFPVTFIVTTSEKIYFPGGIIFVKYVIHIFANRTPRIVTITIILYIMYHCTKLLYLRWLRRPIERFPLTNTRSRMYPSVFSEEYKLLNWT